MNGPTTGMPIDNCEHCGTAAQVVIVIAWNKVN